MEHGFSTRTNQIHNNSERIFKVKFIAAMLTVLWAPVTFAETDCVTSGDVVTCSVNGGTALPTYGSTIGNGRNDNAPGGNGWTIIVGSGAGVDVGDTNAISVGDHNNITIDGIVQNHATHSSGKYGTGANTIEAGSWNTITINGRVTKWGTEQNGEAINVHGIGNTIVVGDRGHVLSEDQSAAIWFQDEVSGARNTVTNNGIIERRDGGNVIGTSGGNGIDFINNNLVLGGLIFSRGDDNLTFNAGSKVTGNIDGGGGSNTLTLNGAAGSNDSLPGALKNFQSLIKDGAGIWTVSGPLQGFNTVHVREGILGLTGNNTNFNGIVTVDSNATLQARAQSLPTSSTNTSNITNNGTVHFVQTDDGSYIGQIVGSGNILKTGGGVLTLTPQNGSGNTYSGGTEIREGSIAISSEKALGNVIGALTLNGGTLQLNNNLTMNPQRSIVIDTNGGTINTQAFGVVLFIREHGGMRQTAISKEIYPALNQAFEQIRGTLETLNKTKAQKK